MFSRVVPDYWRWALNNYIGVIPVREGRYSFEDNLYAAVEGPKIDGKSLSVYLAVFQTKFVIRLSNNYF